MTKGCIVCENGVSLDYYRSFAPKDEINMLVSGWKVCRNDIKLIREGYKKREGVYPFEDIKLEQE